jgi:hypothetical protein
MHQVNTWRAWLQVPANRQNFDTLYRIPDYRHWRGFEPRFVLIIGRRDEFEADPSLLRIRASSRKADVECMTWDRLAPDYNARQYFCVKVVRNGFHAVAFPPTFEVGPMNAASLVGVTDVAAALKRTPVISDERKAFLIERVRYWQDWARADRRGTFSPSDWE